MLEYEIYRKIVSLYLYEKKILCNNQEQKTCRLLVTAKHVDEQILGFGMI